MTLCPQAPHAGFPLFFVSFLVAGLLLSGCGGHHGSSDNGDVTLTATIHWPPLSVATKQASASGITGASTAAEVCIISTTSGNAADGDPIDFTPIIRDPTKAVAGSGTPAYTDAFDQAWNSNTAPVNSQQIRPGATKLQIRFYAQNPTGTTGSVANDLLVASYALLPSVGDSTLTSITVVGPTFDLGMVTVVSTISSVLISPLTVNYGSVATLPVTAYDVTGTAVAPTLQTGAAFFNETTGSTPSIAQNGTVTGSGLGSLTTYATVDKVKSNIVSINGTVGDTTTFKSQSGIQYLDAPFSVIPDATSTAAADSSIAITYTGYFSNDPTNVNSGSYTAFDTANQTTPLTVTVGSDSLVSGLDAGLLGMAVGDQRMIVVPPSLGYGASQVGTVPANSTLIYVVQRTN